MALGTEACLPWAQLVNAIVPQQSAKNATVFFWISTLPRQDLIPCQVRKTLWTPRMSTCFQTLLNVKGPICIRITALQYERVGKCSTYALTNVLSALETAIKHDRPRITSGFSCTNLTDYVCGCATVSCLGSTTAFWCHRSMLALLQVLQGAAIGSAAPAGCN